MSNQEILCDRVVANITNLKRESESLSNRIDNMVREIGRMRQDLEKDRVDSIRSKLSQMELDSDVQKNRLEDQRARIVDSRQDFNKLQCFDLGFSHEVLND